jgi:uncharacterized repeat protein (TIGR03803 family)
VFALNIDGTGFTTLHSFTAMSNGGSGTNSDGAWPYSGLVLSGNTLYGTALQGGTSGNGTVFAVNTDGTGFTNLYSFTALSGAPGTNADGADPRAGLVLSGNTLYGTVDNGGNFGSGTVFKVNTDGTDFIMLHAFGPLSNDFIPTNSDGANPEGLILSGNTLYGTAPGGGAGGSGTVFSLNTDGTGFTIVHSFTAGSSKLGGFIINTDGAWPGGLIASGNALYGTTDSGSSSGNGTVFSISFSPRLAIIATGPNVILTWSTNATGFILQSTTNLISPAVWTAVSPAPVVVNGQNTVTNPISGAQQFYRLAQ